MKRCASQFVTCCICGQRVLRSGPAQKRCSAPICQKQARKTRRLSR